MRSARPILRCGWAGFCGLGSKNEGGREMRKLMLLGVLALGVTVGVIAPVASAHTTAVSVDCNNATFMYTNFSNDTGGTATETVTVDGSVLVSKTFTWGDVHNIIHNTAWENATDIVPINLTGTHTVTVTASNVHGNDGLAVAGSTTTATLTCGSPPPPPSVCTYTKGFYRNHASVTASVIAGMGGSIPLGGTTLSDSQAQAILSATPGKPGGVTFTSNDLLNLAQQTLSAELNEARGSTPAPTAAIAAANLAISVTGGNALAIVGTPDVGSLITPLDSFNSSNDCG